MTVRLFPVCGGGDAAVVDDDPAVLLCCGLPTIDASSSTLAYQIVSSNSLISYVKRHLQCLIPTTSSMSPS